MSDSEGFERCRIGSKDYDADITFVEQYIAVARGRATKEEVISLFRTFQSRILEYIILTRKNLDQLKGVYFTLKNNPEVAQFAQMDYDDLRDRTGRDEGANKVLNNYSMYNHMVTYNTGNRGSFELAQKFFEDTDSYLEYVLSVPGSDSSLSLSFKENSTNYEQLTEVILPAMYKWYNEMNPGNGMYHYTNDVIWDLERNRDIPKSILREFHRINLDPVEPVVYTPSELEDKFKSIIGERRLPDKIKVQMEKSLETYEYNNRTRYSEYILCINEISEQLSNLAYFNCLDSRQFKRVESSIKPSERGLSIDIKLANGTGLFGLNTYLYALFNGYFLIGVPIVFPSYDLKTNDCPGNFVSHDVNHKNIILRSNRYSKYRDVYYEIIKDPKLTIKQKELMIMTIWSLIHEGPLLDRINLNGDPIENSFRSMVATTLFVEFFDEFRRFDDLLLTLELYNEMKDKLSNGIRIETADPLSRDRNAIELNFNSLEELTEYLRNPEIAKVSRGNLYFNLCTVYTLLIISKYYR